MHKIDKVIRYRSNKSVNEDETSFNDDIALIKVIIANN